MTSVSVTSHWWVGRVVLVLLVSVLLLQYILKVYVPFLGIPSIFCLSCFIILFTLLSSEMDKRRENLDACSFIALVCYNFLFRVSSAKNVEFHWFSSHWNKQYKCVGLLVPLLLSPFSFLCCCKLYIFCIIKAHVTVTRNIKKKDSASLFQSNVRSQSDVLFTVCKEKLYSSCNKTKLNHECN